ncbi:MAG: phosphoribosylformylglycinamidine synthase subunit PurQ [Actinomycetota bacterium]
MTKRVAVIVFPGSNCEQDAVLALRYLGADPHYVFHRDTNLAGFDAVVVPGGFSYGDYLRTGAIAAFSPVMESIRDFAVTGGPVVGICNGFQILCEAGLLPGALRRNAGLKFRCLPVDIRVETNETPFTRMSVQGDVLEVPINHFEGNYYCDKGTLQQLEDEDRIVFRYVNNPNGALADIAGIVSAGRNVLGMMPHPERAVDPAVGGTDGQVIFSSMLAGSLA